MTKEEFLIKARERHGDKYDYSRVPLYMKSSDTIDVICHEKDCRGEEHGIFRVNVSKHINRGDGCPKCSGKYKRTREEFIDLANFIHNGFYKYDKFNYVDMKTKGVIFCPKHGIEFMMTPQKHIEGQGCPKCRYEKSATSKSKDTEWFIQRAREIHGDKYDYSKTVYTGYGDKVCIICPEHGEFWQMPSNHIHKSNPQGCPVCGSIKSHDSRRDTTESFIEKAKLIYCDRYDYSRVNYVDSLTNVEIICRKHGPFLQRPANHLIGEGCPKCGCYRSKGEEELLQFITGIYDGIVITNDRSILNGDEIDIVLQENRICFEYDGLYWHNERTKPVDYHLQKTEKCKEAGFRLIHIFEDEWLTKKDIVKSRIRSILGIMDTRVFARKCEIKNVSSKEAARFLDENHIQGKCGSSIRYGLYFNNELMSLMTFGKTRHFIGNSSHEWELLRFCNRKNTNVVGGASRLLKHFIKANKPKNIVSYADRRWSVGNVYETLGFALYNISKPNYFYIVDNKRANRFNYRKSILVKQGFDTNKSEHEIMLERGIYRIYDCGCLCYEMNLE